MGCGGAGLVGGCGAGLAATNSFRFMLHPTTKNGRRLPLTLGVEGSVECRAHGCRIGSDGRRDLTRHGRPAGRAALARSRARAVFAGKYEAIPFVGAQLLGVAVCGARHSVRAAVHGVHAPRA